MNGVIPTLRSRYKQGAVTTVNLSRITVLLWILHCNPRYKQEEQVLGRVLLWVSGWVRISADQGKRVSMVQDYNYAVYWHIYSLQVSGTPCKNGHLNHKLTLLQCCHRFIPDVLVQFCLFYLFRAILSLLSFCFCRTLYSKTRKYHPLAVTTLQILQSLSPGSKIAFLKH